MSKYTLPNVKLSLTKCVNHVVYIDEM